MFLLTSFRFSSSFELLKYQVVVWSQALSKLFIQGGAKGGLQFSYLKLNPLLPHPVFMFYF